MVGNSLSFLPCPTVRFHDEAYDDVPLLSIEDEMY